MKLKVRKKAHGDFSGAMTDISFLLIIFFLVTSVFISTQGILLRLPEPESVPRRLKPDEVISLKLLAGGEIRVEDKALNEDELAAYITRRVLLMEDPVLVLSVEEDCLYDEVTKALEISRENGAGAFSILYESGTARGVKIGEDL
ncbi:MAG: biopolymer transporter ExbD [Spirochaetales bacterium]|nr:biopolymer transporter ExbD [Spirochaetales bacterium]